jgi:glutamine amidotransferase
LVAVVDYGVGNLHSVLKALEHVGAPARLSGDAAVLRQAAGVILPGVGAFAAALEALESRGLRELLAGLAAEGKPLLGVCLGYQLLFEESTEHGRRRGLGLLPGSVDLFPDSVRVPHIGWNQLRVIAPHPLLAGVPDGSFLYFVHSYRPSQTGDWTLALTGHGGEFAAAAARGSVMGTQFHPEKSGEPGLRIYANFWRLCQAA